MKTKTEGESLRRVLKILKNGGIGVMPTDTIYGLCGTALSRRAVYRIYRLRRRGWQKPLIIIIGSWRQLKIFDIILTKELRGKLRRFWPGKVSIVLPCPQRNFFYLHRGTKTLAFRLPADPSLRNFLKKSGPLAAPSANPEELPPASTVEEAREYFGKKADFYLDGGKLTAKPSTLIKFEGEKIVTLRK